ncbi:MAG: TlpA disulfide reductase family protein [Acidobacteriota bacterium]
MIGIGIVGVATAFAFAAEPAGQTAAQAPAPAQTIIQQVRAAIAKPDFAAADKLLADYKAGKGITPEWLEAYSWMGRGYLAARKFDEADRYARETYKMSAAMLKTRQMDDEPRLPIAYGAAVEVIAHVEAERGARTDAILFLERELKTHGATSIAKRVQKNINLLSLEGTKAPAIVSTEYLGPKPPTVDELKGKVVLMFFWAHWCPDCKNMAPVLARLQEEFGSKGFVVFAPTQRYGYTTRGRDAGPDEENRHIDQVRREHYSVLAGQPVPLDEANHLRYGVSTTPTVVLVDRQGIIRLYHPGQMRYEQIQPLVSRLM